MEVSPFLPHFCFSGLPSLRFQGEPWAQTFKDSERAAGVHLESPFHLRLSFPIFNTSRFLPGLGLGRVLSNEERPLVREGDLTTQEVDVCGLAQVRGVWGVEMGKANTGNNLRQRTPR